jgi:hypothetical protein
LHTPKKRVTILAGIAGVGAAGALGLALAGTPALAEDPTPTPSASAPTADKADILARRTQKQDEMAAALAKELGIDKSKVAAAMEKVRAAQQAEAKADRLADLKSRLAAAVKAGTLTEEQSAAILKAAEAGVLPQGGPGGLGGLPGGPGGGKGWQHDR